MPGRLQARVEGRVQGVGFRAYVVRSARALGLGGTVRNNRDGSVEVDATGDDEALRKLHALLRQGPRGSRVDNVEATWGEVESGEDRFVVGRSVR